MYSLFDSFFAPSTIVVVSEERLQAAERDAKIKRLEAVDAKISELREYRQTLAKELEPSQKVGKDLDKLDEAVNNG